MLEVLTLLSQRWVIVLLAIVGALMVTADGLMTGNTAGKAQPAHITALSRAGYAATAISILLFIVAGFMSGR